MKVYVITFDVRSKLKPETYNPIFGVMSDKEEAHKIADNLHGYFVLEKIINEIG